MEMDLYRFPEGRGWNREWAGWEGSFMILVARVMVRDV